MIEKRIVLISIFKESAIGGVAIHSSNLRDRLVNDDYQVEIVDFYSLRSSKYSLLKKIYFLILIFFKLLKLRMIGYKLFHYHTSNKAALYYLTSPLVYLFGGKILISFHSGLGYFKWLQNHYYVKWINKLFFYFVENIIFMNELEVEHISKLYPKFSNKIIKINPFIAPEEKLLPCRNNFDSKKYYISTIGAWVPRYATEEVLEVSIRISKKLDRPLHLTMIQSTFQEQLDYKNKVIEMIDNARTIIEVSLVENTNNSLKYLVNSDLFVRPARGDSYGLCVAESLLMGTPVIATDVCKRCYNTILYSPGDLDELENKMIHLLQNPQLRQNMLNSEEDSYFSYIDLYNNFV